MPNSGNLGGYLGKDLAPRYRDELARIKQETGMTYGKILACGVDLINAHGCPDAPELAPKQTEENDAPDSPEDSEPDNVDADGEGADFDGVGNVDGPDGMETVQDGPEDDSQGDPDDDSGGSAQSWYERNLF